MFLLFAHISSIPMGRALDTGLEEDLQILLRHRGDGTVEIQNWITEVPYDATRNGAPRQIPMSCCMCKTTETVQSSWALTHMRQ